MAKELPYFKFYISEWILGRISDHSDKVQGAFIRAICFYWNAECNYNAVDFKKKLGTKRYDLLFKLEFFELKNEKICIDFLDEQFAQLSKTHKVRVKAGLARAEQVLEQKGSYIDIDKEVDKDKEIDKKKLTHGNFLRQESQRWEKCLVYLRNFNPTATFVDLEQILKKWEVQFEVQYSGEPYSHFTKYFAYFIKDEFKFKQQSEIPKSNVSPNSKYKTFK